MIDPSAKIHPNAIVDDGATVGVDTNIWAFAHILPGARIGKHCNICDHTFIENKVVIGDRVTVKCGVYLWDGLVIEDDVFIGPSATFTNDLKPRSKRYPAEYPVSVIKQGCSVGANATILPATTLGAWSMIAAGAVVTRDVPAHALVMGVPAKIEGWVCRCGERLVEKDETYQCSVCGKSYIRDSDSGLKELEIA